MIFNDESLKRKARQSQGYDTLRREDDIAYDETIDVAIDMRLIDFGGGRITMEGGRSKRIAMP